MQTTFDSERRNLRSFRYSRLLRIVFVIAICLAFGWRLIARTFESSVNIPIWDQWDFYTPLFEHASLWRVFSWQHGPHREGLGLVLDKFLLAWTHWSGLAESLLIVTCFCAAAALALFLKVKIFSPLAYSDAVIPAMFLMPAHLAAITSVPNPSYSGVPELLILVYCLAWTIRATWPRYSSVLLLNFVLIYTGFGVFIGIITIILLLLELNRVHKEGALLVRFGPLAIAAVSFASFFWRYQSSPAKLVRCIEHPHILSYPWFVTLAMSLFFGIRRSIVLGSVLGAAATSGLLWIAMRAAVRLWRDRGSRNRDLVIAVLSSFSLAFLMAAALGRACLGMPGAAQNYRYLGLLVPGFLAGYFQLQLIASDRLRAAAVIILLLLIVPPALRNHTDPENENGKRAWIACLQQGRNVTQCKQRIGFSIYPDPERTHLQQKLDYLKSNGLSFYTDSISEER